MKTIPLTKGKFAMVDDEDYNLLSNFKWFAVKTGGNYYAYRHIYNLDGRKSILMHRQIMGISDSKVFIDHINHNGIDNRKCNLRLASASNNQANTTSRVGSSSKYLGVSFARSKGKFVAAIQVNRKVIHLGYFINEDDAAKAYNDAAIKHHNEFANLNMI